MMSDPMGADDHTTTNTVTGVSDSSGQTFVVEGRHRQHRERSLHQREEQRVQSCYRSNVAWY